MNLLKRTFRLFALLLATCLSFSAVAKAESINYQGLIYEIYPDEGYAVLTGYTTYSSSIFIEESVEYNSESYPVTEIAPQVFKSKDFNSVHFPASLKRVGTDAFSDAHVSTVYIADISAWAQIEFENAAANPYYYVYNRSDQKVSFTYVNDEIFNWDEIILEEPITRVGSYAFTRTDLRNIQLPSTLTSIGDGAFQYSNLSRVDIPDSVTEIGNSAFYDCVYLSYIHLPENLKEVTRLMLSHTALTSVSIPDNVESIGNLAFSDCSSLKSVKLGNVTYFDWHAFQRCPLEQVTVTNISAFLSATFLNDIANPVTISHTLIVPGMEDSVIDNIPEGITTVSNNALLECYNIKSIRLPNSVETIESKAFGNCSNLTSIHFGTGLRELKDDALEGCGSLTSVSIGAAIPPACTKIYGASGATLRVPEGLYEAYSTAPGWKDFKVIIADLDANGQEKFASYIINSGGDGALLYKAKDDVVTANIPASTYIDGEKYPVTGIVTGAFAGNKVLVKVEMPETLEEVGDYAFYNCTALTNVVFGENIRKIGDSAFAECWLLDNIDFPESVAQIGVSSFLNCKSLTTVALPENLKVVPALAFAGCTKLSQLLVSEGVVSIRESAFRGCRALESLATPSSLTEIDEYAFADCENIASLTFEHGLISVGAYAFKNCSSFNKLELPEGVDYVGECSFWNCSGLREVHLPSSISSLGASAFYGCHSIADVYSYSLIPPVCDSYRTTFHHYNSTLHVPQHTKASYAAANEWRKFAVVREDASYVTGIEEVTTQESEHFNVYSVDGKLIKEAATQSDIQNLPRGLYIVNGKKLLK